MYIYLEGLGASKEGAISQVEGDYYQTTQMLQVPITIG